MAPDRAIYKQKGSDVWWYEFQFAGQRIRESAKTKSKTIAMEAMRSRRRQLEENYNSIKKPEPPKVFSAAAKEYIAFCLSEQLAPNTMAINERSVKHLLPFVGKKLLCDINLLDIKRIVDWHFTRGDSNRYANMTIGTLRSILIRNDQWGRLRPFYRKLPEQKNVGKELSHEEETRLLNECRRSSSRGLATKAILGIYTAMRNDEIRSLRWQQINLEKAYLTVGKSKTRNGEGRIIPLIDPARCVQRMEKQMAECKAGRLRLPNRETNVQR